MKCDDFLPALETGGMLRRWLAGRHAQQCSRCAAVRDRWLIAKRDLAAAGLLLAEQRRIWKQAVGESAAQRAADRRWTSLPAPVLAAACILALVVALIAAKLVRRRPVDPVNNGDVAVQVVPSVPESQLVDRSTEFSSLETGVEQLLAQLDVTLVDAQRLDARQQADELLDRYSRW